MGEQKLTGWFGPGEKPLKHGVWQTNHRKSDLDRPVQGYQHWNGRFWGVFDLSADGAANGRTYPSIFQSNYWRGLAHPPKAKP